MSPQRDAANEKHALFHKHLTAWRESLVVLQEGLCGDLVAIALANRNCLGREPIGWIEECVDNFWPERRPGFKNWPALACDWADPQEWAAPMWLLPEVPEAVWQLHGLDASSPQSHNGRLSAPYTALILQQIAALIEMRILMKRTAVLDDARIRLASESVTKDAIVSGESVKRINDAVWAVGRKYGDEWTRKWIESARGLYAQLHPSQQPEDRSQVTEWNGAPAAPAIAEGVSATPTPSKFSHSPDFRSVNWDGKKLSFTSRQAIVVQILHDAWKKDVPEIGQGRILEDLGAMPRTRIGDGKLPKRLRDLFRGHKAWNTLIISGQTRASYRLALPEKVKSPS